LGSGCELRVQDRAPVTGPVARKMSALGLADRLFAPGSTSILANQHPCAAEHNRPPVRGPDGKTIDLFEGEPAGKSALPFQQPEIGAAGPVTLRDNAASVRREPKRHILTRLTEPAQRLPNTVEPGDLARVIGGAVQQQPAGRDRGVHSADGSKAGHGIGQRTSFSCELESLEVKLLSH